MNTPLEVLKRSTQEILTLWETEVRKKIPAAMAESKTTLRDSIPEFLSDLIRALDTDFAEQSADFLRFAHKHGEERANASQYSIEDAITEYNILRRVIFSVLEKKCEVPARERDIIYEAISLALAKAGAEFARTQLRETRELHDRLNIALDSSAIGMYSYDLRTGSVEWNEQLARLYGLPTDTLQLNADSVSRYYHPDDRARIFASLEKAVAEKSVFREKFRIIRSDGSIRWIASTGKPIWDDQGVVTHIIGTNVDITDNKLSRDTIKNLAERLQLITDIQPTMVMYLDPDMNYLFVNQTFRNWYLREPASVIGKNVRDVFPSADFQELREKTRDAFLGQTVRLKQYVNYPAGRKFVDATYKPHLDENGNVLGVFVSVDDRTEERTIIEELRREQDLRDKFVSTLSHDLRTPLTASKMSAQIIARKITDPQIHTHTTRIVDNINRADKLIQDLLDAGKIRAGKLALAETEEFDLVQLIRNTLEDLTTIHGDRFRFSAPPSLTVNLHEEGIRRILENLCTNAIKYGSAHDPVKVRLQPADERVLLSVANTPNPQISIDKEKLFEPFEQALSGKKGGWGIGLTIVKGIAEAHGGKVDVLTDGDTVFTVNLPRDARPLLTQQLH